MTVPAAADNRAATGVTTATCGCAFWTSEDTFIMEPCSEECELVAYAKETAAKQGKTMTYLDLR